MEYNCISAENKTDQSGGEYEVDSNKLPCDGKSADIIQTDKSFFRSALLFCFLLCIIESNISMYVSKCACFSKRAVFCRVKDFTHICRKDGS